MASYGSNPTERMPEFSVIIGARNDWELLEDCLRSLGEQTDQPRFEVIIVDDGSRTPAPDSIRQWSTRYPLTIIREPHVGIAAARNRGIRSSSGPILVFTDADCRFQADSLSLLAAEIANRPQHSCFQFHLRGDCSSLAGRAEELRLIEIQKHMLQAD